MTTMYSIEDDEWTYILGTIYDHLNPMTIEGAFKQLAIPMRYSKPEDSLRMQNILNYLATTAKEYRPKIDLKACFEFEGLPFEAPQ